MFLFLCVCMRVCVCKSALFMNASLLFIPKGSLFPASQLNKAIALYILNKVWLFVPNKIK